MTNFEEIVRTFFLNRRKPRANRKGEKNVPVFFFRDKDNLVSYSHIVPDGAFILGVQLGYELRPGYVYVMRDAMNRVKIGRSKDVFSREKVLSSQLKTASPDATIRLDVFLRCEDAPETEADFHFLLGEQRLSGEWFQASPDTEEFIAYFGNRNDLKFFGCSRTPVIKDYAFWETQSAWLWSEYEKKIISHEELSAGLYDMHMYQIALSWERNDDEIAFIPDMFSVLAECLSIP